MARTYGRMAVSRWQQPEWRALTARAQWCYVALTTQPKLTLAGVIDMKLASWSGWAADVDQHDLREALTELEAAGLVALDWDRDELALTHHVRDDDVLKNSNLAKGMWSAFATIESPELRLFLVDNLPDEAWEPRFDPPFPTREIHRSNCGSDSGSNYLHPATADVTGTAAARGSHSNGATPLGISA